MIFFCPVTTPDVFCYEYYRKTWSYATGTYVLTAGPYVKRLGKC